MTLKFPTESPPPSPGRVLRLSNRGSTIIDKHPKVRTEGVGEKEKFERRWRLGAVLLFHLCI